MKTAIKTILLLILLSNCQETQDLKKQFTTKDGIFFEIPDSINNKYIHSYNNDNKIYLPGKEFIFEYSYLDSLNRKFLFDREGYGLTPVDSINSTTIIKISLKIKDGNSFFDDYHQTVTEYRYYRLDGEAIYPRFHSGIVENNKNIWMHPFRNPCYFRLLQLSPFPFIQKPFEIGNSWKWSLSTGNIYDCEEWGKWEGSIFNHYEYEIMDYQKMQTNFGNLDTYLIKSIGKGDMGKSELLAYFNEKIGFYKLCYKNVNRSQMIIELVEII